MKKLLNVLFKDKVFLFILIIVSIAAYIRFYHLDILAMFLGDQGRDAIIIKRILKLEHLTAIGASTSVGMVFLGPFYYYFIAPWLLFFNYNPAGLAIGVAFFSVIYLIVNYLVVKEIIGKKTAFISTILLSFSHVMIYYSRFSWNPNLMPLFGLLSAYFLFKGFKNNNSLYFILSGSFLSFCVQLHYLALFLVLGYAVFFIAKSYYLIEEVPLVDRFYHLLYSIIAFLTFLSPLFVFDLRHEFINTKSFLNLFKGTNSVASSKLEGFWDAFLHLNKYVLDFEFNRLVLYLIIFIILSIAVYSFYKKRDSIIIFIFFVLTLVGVGMYSGPKNMHYFVAVYPFYFIIIGYFFAILSRNILGKLLTVIFLIWFIFNNYQHLIYFKEKDYSQIDFSKRVAKVIFDNSKASVIQISTLPSEYSESTYRYFVDLWGKRVMERDSLEKVNELFIVCEHECKPIGDPQWDIAYFAPKKVDATWKVDGVTIYKLSH